MTGVHSVRGIGDLDKSCVGGMATVQNPTGGFKKEWKEGLQTVSADKTSRYFVIKGGAVR